MHTTETHSADYRWFCTYAAYFGAISLGIGQLVYDYLLAMPISLNLRDMGLLVLQIVSVILALTSMLALARLVVGSAGWLVDILVYSGALLSLFHTLQRSYYPLGGEAASANKIVLLATTTVFALGITYLTRQHLTRFMIGLAGAYMLYTAYLIHTYPTVNSSPPISPMSQAAMAQTTGTRVDTVFIFFFDEISLDMLLDETGLVDQDLFPHLHEFSKESLWFRQAIANYNVTRFSIPSAIKGTILGPDEEHRWRDINEKPNLLSSLMHAGYKINFYSSSFPCEPKKWNCVGHHTSGGSLTALGFILAATLKTNLPDFLRHRVLDAVAQIYDGQMLAELGTSEFNQPGQVSLFHIILPHHPYLISANGTLNLSGDYNNFIFTAKGNMNVVRARYREQIKFLDNQFGSFINGLKASGTWDRTTIVVTSDHGECWKPGCMGRHNIEVVEPSVARIPMMIRIPGRASRILDNDYQHVDFHQTVIDALNIPPIDEHLLDGRSALSEQMLNRRRLFFVVKERSMDSYAELSSPPHRANLKPLPPNAWTYTSLQASLF